MKGIVKGLIIGGVIAVIGIVILIVTLASNGWKIKKAEFEMQTYTAETEFTKIKIDIEAGSARTEFYDGEKVIIEYPASSAYKNQFETEDSTLIYSGCARDWFFNTGNLNVPETVIKIPNGSVYGIEMQVGAGAYSLADGEYGNIKINLGSGVFSAERFKCAEMKFEVGMGHSNIKNFECRTLDCEVGMGDITIEQVTCSGAKIDVGLGSAHIGFSGAKEEYNISTDIGLGSCNVAEQTGTTDKTIEIDVGAGSAVLDFKN